MSKKFKVIVSIDECDSTSFRGQNSVEGQTVAECATLEEAQLVGKAVEAIARGNDHQARKAARARRRGRLQIISELRARVKDCAISDMTFAPLKEADKPGMADYVARAFRIWSESWILPRLDELEAKEK